MWKAWRKKYFRDCISPPQLIWHACSCKAFWTEWFTGSSRFLKPTVVTFRNSFTNWKEQKSKTFYVEAQQKSCLNLVIFHISLAYTANNQRSKTAAGLQTLSFSSLLPQATSANWIFFGNSTRMKLALIHNITVFVCNGDKCIPDSFIKFQTMIFEFCRVQRG